MPLTKNQIIKSKDGTDYKVLAIADGACLMSFFKYVTSPYGKDKTVMLSKEWFTDQEIEENFEKPKEKWRPIFGQNYWYITSIGHVDYVSYNDSMADKKYAEYGNMFPDEKSAIEARNKIQALLKELKQ